MVSCVICVLPGHSRVLRRVASTLCGHVRVRTQTIDMPVHTLVTRRVISVLVHATVVRRGLTFALKALCGRTQCALIAVEEPRGGVSWHA